MTNNESYVSTLDTLPISVNGFYGDSMQPTQWSDTLQKLESLQKSGHRGHVMVPTKWAVTTEQVDTLAKYFPDVWLWMSITGLNETPLFTLTDYEASYLNASSKLRRVICAIRPIVPGVNDNMKTLRPILEMVRKGGRKVTFTGYRDPFIKGSAKHSDTALAEAIYGFGKDNGLLVEEKCVCMVASSEGTPCILHSQSEPVNVDFLELLGYEFRDVDGTHVLINNSFTGTISRGDLGFVRLVTKSNVQATKFINSEILSLPSKRRHSFVSTSSWFSWARQVPCIVGCNYCFADYNSTVRIPLPNFGCNPAELLENLDLTRPSMRS